jgi:hypothetical protein
MSLALPMVLAVVLAACGQQVPVRSFDPTAACTTDGQQPGAYPDLEALLPSEYEGKAPDNVDSGRTCTPEGLGTLAGVVDEVRFAGATWDTSGTSGLTLAVFTGEGLDPSAMRDFYGAGAQAARRTEKLVPSDTTVAGKPAKRLDVLQSDGTGQTIITWQDADDGPVWVLLAADIGDTKVAEAAEAFASR